MTLQELIDTECNRVLEELCAKRYLRKSDVQGRSIKSHLVKARRDTSRILAARGFRNTDIARTLKCHHGTVKYWTDDETRSRRREQCADYASQRRGNVRDTQRDFQTSRQDTGPARKTVIPETLARPAPETLSALP